MAINKLEKLWSQFPESHLHYDVTRAGQDSYALVVSLIDKNDTLLARVQHFGSGNLDTIKDSAFERLAEKLDDITVV